MDYKPSSLDISMLQTSEQPIITEPDEIIPEIILEDEDLTAEEKCDYFLMSELPVLPLPLYGALLAFFWEGFMENINCAACVLKLILTMPLESIFLVIPFDSMINCLHEDLNPIFAAILACLSPIFDEIIWPIEELIEHAVIESEPAYINLILEYYELYVEFIQIEHFEALLCIDDPSMLYRRTVIRLFKKGLAKFHDLEERLIDLENELIDMTDE